MDSFIQIPTFSYLLQHYLEWKGTAVILSLPLVWYSYKGKMTGRLKSKKRRHSESGNSTLSSPRKGRKKRRHRSSPERRKSKTNISKDVVSAGKRSQKKARVSDDDKDKPTNGAMDVKCDVKDEQLEGFEVSTTGSDSQEQDPAERALSSHSQEDVSESGYLQDERDLLAPYKMAPVTRRKYCNSVMASFWKALEIGWDSDEDHDSESHSGDDLSVISVRENYVDGERVEDDTSLIRSL
ncbi:uncharacterized protein [Ptychodera flava]|uniref:uncharacterized protein n=1 Tax=Ptychodera flava TaxID=63121 RepID=UPI00396A61C4